MINTTTVGTELNGKQRAAVVLEVEKSMLQDKTSSYQMYSDATWDAALEAMRSVTTVEGVKAVLCVPDFYCEAAVDELLQRNA